MTEALSLFRTLMEQGIAKARQRIRDMAERDPEHAEQILSIAAKVHDLDEGDYGFLESVVQEIMADVLLEMDMGQWETFYQGYVEWSKLQPKCPYRGREEENARGAMLMALKYRCIDLQWRLDRAKEKK